MPSHEWEEDPWLGRELAEQVEVRELIGVGAMGRVYRGHQRGIERAVAVKVLHADLMHRSGVLDRFHREARVASRLNHPNVVQVLMTGEVMWRPSAERDPSTIQGMGARASAESDRDDPSSQKGVYLVMEYLDGDSLASVLEKHGGPLRLERALHIALQVCDAVGEAHDQGIVHRDLKPENVMLVRRGGDPDFVKVLDFGVAKVDWLDGAQATQVGTVFGTARYMAPEAARGELVTPRSDVYSIATLLYQMLTARTPFDGTNTVAVLVKQCSELPLELTTIAPQVPGSIAQVVHQNLSKAPGERCSTARELGAALLSAARAANIEGIAATSRPTLQGVRRTLIEPADSFAPEPQVAPSQRPSSLPPRGTIVEVPRETTLIDPELAGTPAGAEPHRTRRDSRLDYAEPLPTPLPPPPRWTTPPPAHPTRPEQMSPPTPPYAGPAFPGTHLGHSTAWRDEGVNPHLWAADGAPPSHPRKRPRRALRWALVLSALMGVAGAGSYLVMRHLQTQEESLTSYLDRANAALAIGAWQSDGVGEGFVEITDAALARYPGAPDLLELRQRGARRLAREARRLQHIDQERALSLAELAQRLAPNDSAVLQLTKHLAQTPTSEVDASMDTAQAAISNEPPVEASALDESALEGSSPENGASEEAPNAPSPTTGHVPHTAPPKAPTPAGATTPTYQPTHKPAPRPVATPTQPMKPRTAPGKPPSPSGATRGQNSSPDSVDGTEQKRERWL